MSAARLAPEAAAELREAASWYKQRSPEVARRFLREVRALARSIGVTPLRFPVLLQPELAPPRSLRRALVPSFPYALVFVVGGAEVRIVAVAHHRRAGYWLHRIRLR